MSTLCLLVLPSTIFFTFDFLSRDEQRRMAKRIAKVTKEARLILKEWTMIMTKMMNPFSAHRRNCRAAQQQKFGYFSRRTTQGLSRCHLPYGYIDYHILKQKIPPQRSKLKSLIWWICCFDALSSHAIGLEHDFTLENS